MSKPFAVHWFRRDLRLSGNPALAEAHAKSGGRVLGFFCFDPIFLARPDFSVNRFQFFLESLAALRDDLRQAGSELLVVDEGPDKAFARLFQQVKPHWVSFNRDYEPFAVARDERMRRFFFEQHTVTVEECDHLILEPSEVTKPNTEEGYSVFTPFSRRWFDLFDKNRVERQRPHKKQLHCNLRWSDVLKSPLNDVLDTYREKNRKHVTITIPKAGAHAAAECLKAFAPKINDYARARDVPSEVGTSHLSIYLKNGSITTAQIIGALELTPAEGRKKTSRGRFLTELVWREFYYHILARHPRVETEEFKTKYANLPYRNNEKQFRAWCEGRTGFPIVDAGMRQLNATGWMHNRVRMIVASFLTKDLLIDYRWGERYFMEKLLDGDLAPNNGGWQWAASTGCDPQPYFRIFNPALQGKRFDPNGDYVRRWIPELAKVPAKEVHTPGDDLFRTYPAPIVDHGTQRDAALALFRGRA